MNSPLDLRAVIRAAVDRRHFFLAPGVDLRIEEQPRLTRYWEVFRGHLLDQRATRLERTFHAWHVWIDDPQSQPSGAADQPGAAAEQAPLVSLLFDDATSELFVARNVLSRGWRVIETRPGVLESQPAPCWSTELVGTLDFRVPSRAAAPRDIWTREVSCLLGMAWTGVSRLPITSIESPLPTFSLGRSAYAEADEGENWSVTAEELLAKVWRDPTHARSDWGLEVALRALPTSALDECLAVDGEPGTAQRHLDLPAARAQLVRRLFHRISLSPFTHFTANVLALLDAARRTNQMSSDQVVDTLAYMVRHLVRHLTAYDLVRFHSFGANYPDALWLDQLLRALLRHAAQRPELFLEPTDGVAPQENDRLSDPTPEQATKQTTNQATVEAGGHSPAARRMRRRALRQAWVVRYGYEGLKVPQTPTSQGEHARILPGAWESVPEEQITQPQLRPKQLFADAPTVELAVELAGEPTWQVLLVALSDLKLDGELRELGMATFLDRPFGIFKPNGAVDRTPLLAYEAFSREVARRRLELLESSCRAWFPPIEVERARRRLGELPLSGTAAASLPGESRPGVISLEDARQSNPDFVVLRTTRGSLRRLAEAPGRWTPEQRVGIAAWGDEAAGGLLIRVADASAARAGRPWLEWRDGTGAVRASIRLVETGQPTYAEQYGQEYLDTELELFSE